MRYYQNNHVFNAKKLKAMLHANKKPSRLAENSSIQLDFMLLRGIIRKKAI